MKRLVTLLIGMSLMAMVSSAFAVTPDATTRGTGVGLIIGEPTGLSLKFQMTNRHAFAIGAAWSFRRNNSGFHLHGDYLIHKYNVFKIDSGELVVYYGLGGRIKFHEGKDDTADNRASEVKDDTIGIRVPVGLDYYFENSRIDAFIEIVPVLDIAPDTDFELMGAIGVRYNF